MYHAVVILSILNVLIIFTSCNGSNTNQQIHSDAQKLLTYNIDKPGYVVSHGEIELKQVIRSIDTLKNFPNCEFTTAIVYELDEKPNHSWEDSAFYQRTGKAKELSKSQIDTFLKLITDPSSYEGSI